MFFGSRFFSPSRIQILEYFLCFFGNALMCKNGGMKKKEHRYNNQPRNRFKIRILRAKLKEWVGLIDWVDAEKKMQVMKRHVKGSMIQHFAVFGSDFFCTFPHASNVEVKYFHRVEWINSSKAVFQIVSRIANKRFLRYIFVSPWHVGLLSRPNEMSTCSEILP